MNARVMRMAWQKGEPAEALTTREWLIANGLGGYACGTLGGVSTRRFHGLLVAALPAPLGRTMIVSRVDARVRVEGATFDLEGTELFGESPTLPDKLTQVRFEDALPSWRYEVRGVVLEKRIVTSYARNTACVLWRLVAARGDVTLEVRPSLHVRAHEGSLAMDPACRYPVTAEGTTWTLTPEGGVPPIRLRAIGARVAGALDPQRTRELNFREEQCRGYDHVGSLVTVGTFAFELSEGHEAALVMTTEPLDVASEPASLFEAERQRRAALIDAADPGARVGVGAELVLAADAFIVRPTSRVEEAAHGAGLGEEARTIIAGYHWFTDWGRDTMISLEGLTLLTGRSREARHILTLFARHLKDGLIPNLFPEGKSEGLYHTADASLWFFHAIDRYVERTGDRDALRELLPSLMDIVRHHVAGTRFGIRIDPLDGLLQQGAEGFQLTWMDAKVDGWVVTPRRGKAVEINALWFNALSLVSRWVEEAYGAGEAASLYALCDRVKASFNRRFWCESRGHLYDVVDGDNELRGDPAERRDDPSLRPNQILAVSLPNPVLDPARWGAVLETTRAWLLTPVGLRSLGPQEPDYKPSYDGDLRSRDAAYHQGTVWGWLAGPYIDAHLRVHPGDAEGARKVVRGFAPHLGEACIGSVSEIFDGEAPFVPRGCVAQAWSVAELLRGWVKTGASMG